MEYSENVLRGIRRDDWVQDGLVTTAAFQFDTAHLKDRWMIQSICWEDDDSVCSIMFQQKKNDEIHFEAGIARLPRASIDYINRLYSLKGMVSYEREPLEDNPYHGNLMLSIESNKTQRRWAQVQLASHVVEFIPRSK